MLAGKDFRSNRLCSPHAWHSAMMSTCCGATLIYPGDQSLISINFGMDVLSSCEVDLSRMCEKSSRQSDVLNTFSSCSESIIILGKLLFK